MTFVQRFGSALNLNPHFHVLMLDGVYASDTKGAAPAFRLKTSWSDGTTHLLLSPLELIEKLSSEHERKGGCRREC